MVSERKIGRILLRFEPPDILFEAIAGDISEGDARGVVEATADLTAGAEDVYILADIARVGSVSMGARSILREAGPSPNVRAYTLVGASWPTRTLATLLLKGLSIFWKHAAEVRFFEAEGQARAWIAELRERRAASKGG